MSTALRQGCQKHTMGKGQSLQHMVLGKDSLCNKRYQKNKKNEIRSLYHTQKSNQKLINNLNITPETVKFFQENIGEKLYDTGLGNAFLDMTPKTQAIKAKIDKWDYIKFKSFCIKSQPIEWEKILANHISDKGLISKIYKELLQLNSKKKKKI